MDVLVFVVFLEVGKLNCDIVLDVIDRGVMFVFIVIDC